MLLFSCISHASYYLLPYEAKACIEWVSVCIYIVSRGTPCCVCNFLFVHGSKHRWPLQRGGEIHREVEQDKKKDWEKRKERGERGKNRMITKAARISQTHISSIMWISRGDYAWRWQAEGGLITIHHKGCFLISHTLISFCLQIASHSSLFLTHTQTLMGCVCRWHTQACICAHANSYTYTHICCLHSS